MIQLRWITLYSEVEEGWRGWRNACDEVRISEEMKRVRDEERKRETNLARHQTSVDTQ